MEGSGLAQAHTHRAECRVSYDRLLYKEWPRERERSHLPVLGLALQHHGILGLALLALVVLLDLLSALLGLDAFILGEGPLVPRSPGVGEEVRADGLDGPLRRGRDGADGLEVLLCGPARGQRG